MKPRHAAAPSPFMTAPEVAELLRVNLKTVYKLIEQGSIPAFRIGFDYRFARDEIVKFTSERTTKRQ